MFKSPTLKKVMTALVVLMAALFLANLHATKALAYDGNTCGIHTGNGHDYEGLVATVSVVQQDGSVVAASGTQDYVHVTSSFASGAPRAAILFLNSSLGIISGPYQDVSFSLYGGGAACYGDGVLGYGGTSVSTINGNAGGWWVLDCDTSTGTPSYFTINGQGVPANGIAGGYWTGGQEVGPLNGGTQYVNLVYHDPAAVIPPYWTRGSVDVANCSEVGGWDESDPDGVLSDPYPPTNVDIYINGPAGSGAPGARYTANVFRSDVGAHGYVISPAADGFMAPYYNSGSPFTIYVYFIGQGGAGNIYEGAWTIGPCVFPPAPPNISITPSCSAGTVNITASDSTSPVNMTITYSSNNGGPSGSTSTGNNSISFNIPMNGYDPTKAYNFSATVTASNSVGRLSNSATATYGPCDRFAPTINATSSCSATNVSFTVKDTDNTAANSTINYSVDGTSYNKSTSVVSNGTSTVTINMSGYDQLVSHTIYAYTLGVQQSGAPGNRQVFISPNPVTYGPCYSPLCGTGTVSPAVIEPNQNFNYSVTLNFTPLNGAGAITPTTNIGGALTVFMNGGQIGNFTPSTSPPLRPAGNAGSGITGPSATGLYALSWTFADGAVTTSPSPCGGGGTGPTLTVAYKPIFQVVGGDISVGGGFEPNCTAPANPSAIGWNQNNAPTYSGAGDQFAVYALGPINGFSTSQGNNSLTPYGLSFANNLGLPTTPPDQFGGGLSQTSCASDFYAGHPTPTGGAGSWTSLISGSYTGTQTTNGGNIPNGQHITVYVQGDVYINGNITLGNGPYASPKDIPSFELVVEGGNIIIAPGVTEVDGTYIAEPDTLGNNGTIATCKYTTKTATSDPSCVFGIAGGTGGPLLVKGSFVARSIIFARSNNDNNGAVPAETIIFSPAEWLSGSGSSSVIPNKYDSITNLPPVL